MSIMRTIPNEGVGPVHAASIQQVHFTIPQLDDIDHLQGILWRWRRGQATVRDLDMVATKLDPIMLHIQLGLSGLDPEGEGDELER